MRASHSRSDLEIDTLCVIGCPIYNVTSPLPSYVDSSPLMSYASVTAKGLPPTSAQPHPDTTLLNTQQAETQLPSVEAKIIVAPTDFKEHPRVRTTHHEHYIVTVSPDVRR